MLSKGIFSRLLRSGSRSAPEDNVKEKDGAPWRPRAAATGNGRGNGDPFSAEGGDAPAPGPSWPTVWGLDPGDLHDRYWASRGVEVVRPGVPLARGADSTREYLLIVPQHLVTFRPDRLSRALARLRQRSIALGIRNQRTLGCREVTVTGTDLQLTRFQRFYDRPDRDDARVVLTRDPELARRWSEEGETTAVLELVESATARARRTTAGFVFDTEQRADVMAFVRHLLECWKEPGLMVERARRLDIEDDIWVDERSTIPSDAKFVGPVWIGAARNVPSNAWVVGPTVLWDDPAYRPPPAEVRWDSPKPVRNETHRANGTQDAPVKRSRPVGPFGKRVFDIVFSLAALSVTLPLYPFVMFVIWCEDGWPFFFAHRRQTFGGREFPCFKFRTMRKDAEALKLDLLRNNQADGPQFFMDKDPRLLRSGHFLRKTQIDELPQFFNVLLGHMSVVGPRPSPFDENQYSPSWREARLTARPGITGLWQVCRTRRQGQDFQEWIRYDIEYVENASWKLELWIVWKTFQLMGRDLLRLLRSATRRRSSGSLSANAGVPKEPDEPA